MNASGLLGPLEKGLCMMEAQKELKREMEAWEAAASGHGNRAQRHRAKEIKREIQTEKNLNLTESHKFAS